MKDHLNNTLVIGDTIICLDDMSAHIGIVVGFKPVMLQYVDGSIRIGDGGAKVPRIRSKTPSYCIKLTPDLVTGLIGYKLDAYKLAIEQAKTVEIKATTGTAKKSNIEI